MEFNNKQINPGYGLLQKTLLIIFLLLGGCTSKNINIKKDGTLTKDGDVSEEKIDNIKMSEFILGAGDEIEISVYRHDDL